MKELGSQAGVDDAAKDEPLKSMNEPTKTSSGIATPRPNDFQSTIKETMRKLKEGGNSDTVSFRSNRSTYLPLIMIRRVILNCNPLKPCLRIWA